MGEPQRCSSPYSAAFRGQAHSWWQQNGWSHGGQSDQTRSQWRQILAETPFKKEMRREEGGSRKRRRFNFFFFPQTKTLLGIQIRRNCGVEPNRKRADVTPRLTSKLTKQQSVVLLGAFAIPASALISLHAFEEGGTASFHAAAPRTRQRQRRNVFPTAGGRWETTERWS